MIAQALIHNYGKEATMRMMLRFTVPVEKGNDGVNNGSIGRTVKSLLQELKPEAAYFLTDGGERSGMMFFDMADPAQIPQIAEQLFQNLDAAVEFVPVMNSDDLRRGLEQVSTP